MKNGSLARVNSCIPIPKIQTARVRVDFALSRGLRCPWFIFATRSIWKWNEDASRRDFGMAQQRVRAGGRWSPLRSPR
jgi:hypothetical protein